MPIVAASSEVQFYMDRAGGAGGGGGGERDCSNKESKAVTSHHNHSSHHSGGGTAGGSGAGYRILKVRVSDQCDKDFVEIDLPTDKLSIQVCSLLIFFCPKGLTYFYYTARVISDCKSIALVCSGDGIKKKLKDINAAELMLNGSCEK